MSDFEQLVRETGFVFHADVGQGPQDLVVTISGLGLDGTQVASEKELALAGFVPTDRLRTAEESLANVRARLKDVDANHQALKNDYEAKLETLRQDHADELDDLREDHAAEVAELQRAAAALRQQLSVREDVWANEKSRLLADRQAEHQAHEAEVARLRQAHEAERAAWAQERAALTAAHEEAEAAWDRERDALVSDHETEVQRIHAVHGVEKNRLVGDREALTHEVALWSARHRAEREGIAARNEGVTAEGNPYTDADEVQQTAHQAWRHGWMLRDGLLRLNEHAGAVQAERDNLVRAMEKAKPEIERLLEDNQRLRTSTEALRDQYVRLHAEHEETRQALETCQSQLKAWRENEA